MGLFGKKKKAAKEEAARAAEQAQQAAAGYQGQPSQMPGQGQPYADSSQWGQAGATTQQADAQWGQAGATAQQADAQWGQAGATTQQADAQWGQAGVAASPDASGQAAFGGPPGAPLGADDPLWQPIYGLTVDHYAQIVKYAGRQGIQDAYSICQFAQQHYGIAPETWNAASAGWVERMGQSTAVSERFRQVYDAS